MAERVEARQLVPLARAHEESRVVRCRLPRRRRPPRPAVAAMGDIVEAPGDIEGEAGARAQARLGKSAAGGTDEVEGDRQREAEIDRAVAAPGFAQQGRTQGRYQ